jgi:hypothetical protein
MDSADESSIASDDLPEGIVKVRRRAKKPAAKKPTKTKRKKAASSEGVPYKVKKQFLTDIEELGSYSNIGLGKKHSLKSIVAERPELYEPYYNELSNLIYYFRRRNQTQYRSILDQHQVTPCSIRSLSSRQEDFDSEPDPESIPDEARPRTTMPTTGGPPRARGGVATSRVAAPTLTTHSGTLL